MNLPHALFAFFMQLPLKKCASPGRRSTLFHCKGSKYFVNSILFQEEN